MSIRIALAGNPNSGKTTLFNALTGSSQYVGNWPGVTVEKKEGKLKDHADVKIADLPGIYSLSPYTMEEVIARRYLMEESPDAILNIIDGTNLERNLYLTTQLLELGIPMVIAVNMMDVVEKTGDKLDIQKLSEKLGGCEIVQISALKNRGVMEAAEAAIRAAEKKVAPDWDKPFQTDVEDVLSEIQGMLPDSVPENHRRWIATKLFEHDEKINEAITLSESTLAEIESKVSKVEEARDDDAESIMTFERYHYIENALKGCYKKESAGKLSVSDRIDKIVTNRVLGLPIFALVMFIVYWIAMVGLGKSATDFTNDNIFGDGFHLFGNGTAQFEEKKGAYDEAMLAIKAYVDVDPEAEDFDADKALAEVKAVQKAEPTAQVKTTDEETLEETMKTVYFDALPNKTEKELEDENIIPTTFKDAQSYVEKNGFEAPDPADYGTWIPGVPVLIENGLNKIHVDGWLKGLILDGIVAGVGAVLGFVPQMLVLFFLLAILEDCGYMARIAFVLDRIFRKFGLSGKSFIPMLIGSGCGVPGIMASRTIENESDRRMAIITTTFIPCSAKIPFIALVSGAIFGGSSIVSTSAYFVGMAAIIISGVMLKKTAGFAGEPAPFVMELPQYHIPTIGNVLRSMWERGRSFIMKAGTVILLATIIVWFTSFFGFTDEGFRMLEEDELSMSILATFGNAIAWIFKPLGWGNWQAAVASVTGLIAKENIVGTMGILYGGGGSVWTEMGRVFTSISGYSFLVFNLLCAPCFAAMGAIKREMNNTKWTLFAIGYQCVFAYMISLMIYQFGTFFKGNGSIVGLIAAVIVLLGMLYMLFIKKPNTKPAGISNPVKAAENN